MQQPCLCRHGMDAALVQCSYSFWYNQYSSITCKSLIVDLTPEFIEFLHEEGITVCSSSKALPTRSKPTEIVVEGVDYDPEDTYSTSSSATAADAPADTSSDSGSDAAEEQQPWHQRFPELHAAIEAAIQQLGGQVAPRLNWSSPIDAVWISAYNSLKCSNADQVILLLKSSDRVMHDLAQLQQLNQPQQSTEPQQQAQSQQDQQNQQHQGQALLQQPSAATAATLGSQLVLRRWQELLPEREFRCFAAGHALVGISQRDPSQHFPQLGSTGEVAAIRQQLLTWHEEKIRSSFPLDSYAMDVYVPAAGGPVQLLDFSPICSTTSPLLFSWDELPYHHMHTAAVHLETLTSCPAKYISSSSQIHQQQQQQEPIAAAVAAVATTDSGRAIELRVVQHAGMVLPGVRAATGMPIDMLGLQDSFEEVMHTMQQQQQKQQQQQQQQ